MLKERLSSPDGTPKSKFTYRHLNVMSSNSPPKENPLRCVVLIDLDCFYAQVEQVRLGIPKDEPLAASLPPSKGLMIRSNNGRASLPSTSTPNECILSLEMVLIHQFHGLTSSPARTYGVGRHIAATEARKLCPNIHLAHVQTWAEGDSEPQYHTDPKVATHKVSLDPYRRASLKILEIFRAHCDRVEKASIDESFIDLSSEVKQKLLDRYPELTLPPPYNDMSCQLPTAPTITYSSELGAIVPLSEGESEDEAGDWDDVSMSIAAELIRDIRREVEVKLGYTCSAGIARNKMLAKLGAGWKKPNQQTVLRNRAVLGFLKDVKFTKIRNLGGKFGAEVASVLDTEQVSDIWKYTADQLRAKLGQEQGSWVYNVCRGIDYSEVNPRTKIKSMLSAKNFQPALNTSESAARWLRVLTADLASRLQEDEDHRLPKTIVIHHRHGRTTKSRQAPLPVARAMDKELLFAQALSLWHMIEMEGRAFPANNISIALSGFGDVEDGVQGIQAFLVKTPSSTISPNPAKIEGLGKRKRAESSGITKFFSQRVQDSLAETSEPIVRNEQGNDLHEDDPREDREDVDDLDDTTYLCQKCDSRIPLEEIEVHEDYHVALELSRGLPSPPQKAGTGQHAKKQDPNETRKHRPKKGRKDEKGQMKLEFTKYS